MNKKITWFYYSIDNNRVTRRFPKDIIDIFSNTDKNLIIDEDILVIRTLTKIKSITKYNSYYVFHCNDEILYDWHHQPAHNQIKFLDLPDEVIEFISVKEIK